jgi:Zn-dependent metalloprotease
MGEAFSDWIATAVKEAYGVNNWILTLGPLGATTRNLADPLASTPSPQPAYYGGKYWTPYDETQIHKYAGVPNKMFFLLGSPGVKTFNNITVSSIGIDKAIKIAYKANIEEWGRNLTFADAMGGMVHAAEKLGYSQSDIDQVKNAWAAVGVKETSTPASLIFTRIYQAIMGWLDN